jgi:hypothetical protein
LGIQAHREVGSRGRLAEEMGFLKMPAVFSLIFAIRFLPKIFFAATAFLNNLNDFYCLNAFSNHKCGK